MSNSVGQINLSQANVKHLKCPAFQHESYFSGSVLPPVISGFGHSPIITGIYGRFLNFNQKTIWCLKRGLDQTAANKMSSAIVRRKSRNGISPKEVDISKEIDRSNQLKSQGLISEEELEKAKQKI